MVAAVVSRRGGEAGTAGNPERGRRIVTLKRCPRPFPCSDPLAGPLAHRQSACSRPLRSCSRPTASARLVSTGSLPRPGLPRRACTRRSDRRTDWSPHISNGSISAIAPAGPPHRRENGSRRAGADLFRSGGRVGADPQLPWLPNTSTPPPSSPARTCRCSHPSGRIEPGCGRTWSPPCVRPAVSTPTRWRIGCN